MGSLASIYLRLIGSQIRSQLQYRVSFAAGVFGNMLLAYADLVAILVFFHHIPALGGWSFGEVAFLYGASYIAMKLADGSVGHVEQLPTYIRAGTFDVFLRRPLGSLFQLISSHFTFRMIGGVVQGIGIFVYALTVVEIDWTLARAAVLAGMLVSAYVIYVAVWIATNSIAFWLVDTREVANAFTYGGNLVSQYPLHIFAGWARRLFTAVVPIAFVNYLPTLFILGKPEPFGGSILRVLSPAVALAAALVSRAIWRAGVRHYRSTGS